MYSEEDLEEDELAEQADGFNADVMEPPPWRAAPNRSLASMGKSTSEVGTSSTTARPYPRSSVRRGSVVQVGGRSTALSQSAELAVTLRRLKAANESGDANIMQAALTAAGGAAHMVGPEAAELQALAMSMASRLAEDRALAKVGQLRRSSQIRAGVRRLWDLMVAESTTMRKQVGAMRPGEVSQDVTIEAYRSMHIRVAKVLAFKDAFDKEEALKIAAQDWAEDISRFSGTSHITVWLDEIRTKFKEASARAVAEHSFRELFKTFDADGSGELDRAEFRQAVREKLDISEQTISAEELETLFGAVDADGSGEVDSNEFVTWLYPPKLARTPKGKKRGKKKRVAKSLLRASSESALKDRFREASSRMSEAVGWELIFQKYDDDNSGELEIDEFTRAVREECELSEEAVPDHEIDELFGVIDSDQSGAIDSEELGELLNADLGAGSMTFGPFFSSIFELVSVWVPVESERSYVRFLEAVFNAITDPINGHECDLDTAKVPVFDDEHQMVANFRLKQLDLCLSLVAEDGNLNIDDLETANAQDILPENNPLSPAYIENKQAKGRERRKSLSATVSNSSLTSPRAQAGSNTELPTPSPQEESLPVLVEDGTENEDGPVMEPEPEPESEPEPEPPSALAASAVNQPRKKFQPRPPPPKLALSDVVADANDTDKFGEGGWRRLDDVLPATMGQRIKRTHADPRGNVASHWTYGAAPPPQPTTTAAPRQSVVPAGRTEVVRSGGHWKRPGQLPSMGINSKTAETALSGPAPSGAVEKYSYKSQRQWRHSKPRPSVQVDAIIGTGPLSGRRLWSSGSIRGPPATAGSRLTTPRVLGAAGFRFAPPPSRREDSIVSLESELTRSATSKIAVGSMEEPWTSPFKKIGGRMVPPMAPVAIPNRPHTGHCTVSPECGATQVPNILLCPAVVLADGSTTREALGYGENPLHLHLVPGAERGTPRSSRGLRTRRALQTPALSPGKPHRGAPHNLFDMATVDLTNAAATCQDPPALAAPRAGSWGRLPPGEMPLSGVATR